jgi:hypothetical protein
MIKTITKISLLAAITLSHNSNFAQQATGEQNVASKFNFARPSLTEIYFIGGLQKDELIYESFKSLGKLANERADHNNLGFPKITGDIDPDKEGYDSYVKQNIQKYVNNIVSMWWSRDSKGNMSDALVKQRGDYTATDGQVTMDKAAQISRLGEMGYKLIEKSYILVYDIVSVKTMEQEYDERDANNKKKVEANNKKIQEQNKKLKSGEKPKELQKFVPVKRIQQGWIIDYKCSMYKLLWNSEIQDDFFNNMWVDELTIDNRSSKIQMFNSKNFSFVSVKSWTNTTKITELKKETDVVNPQIMTKLLSQTGYTVQYEAMHKIQKTIDDFILRANIFSAYPILVKLGSKEALRKESRYYVYDMVENKKGQNKKKRVGWTYVTKVVNNSMVANGQLPTSKMQQHGGKKLYSGMLLEEHDDWGASVTLGSNFGNQFYNGFNLGLEFNTSKLIHLTPGLYLGANIYVGSSSGVNVGSLDYFTTDSTKYDISRFGLNVTLGKEFYLTKRGGFYLYPQVGFGIASMTIKNTPYDVAGIVGFGSLKVGYNILPWLGIYSSISVFGNGNTIERDSGGLTQNSKNLGEVNKSFTKIGKAPPLFGIGIKFRL